MYQNQQRRHRENVTSLSPALNTARYSGMVLAWSTTEGCKNLFEEFLKGMSHIKLQGGITHYKK